MNNRTSKPLMVIPKPAVDQNKLASFAALSDVSSHQPSNADTVISQPLTVSPADTDVRKKPILFQISVADRKLLEAVFIASTYKSRQEMFESLFIPALRKKAVDLGLP